MYQSALKKKNNDIPDQYHLDDVPEPEYHSGYCYGSFGVSNLTLNSISPYLKDVPIKMEYPFYMIPIPTSSYADNFETGLPIMSYPMQQPPTQKPQIPLQNKQTRPKKTYKKRRIQAVPQQILNHHLQQYNRNDDSDHEIWQYGQDELEKSDIEKKILFQQTLTGFVLRLFEIHQNSPLSERYIVEQVRANLNKLKRLDGSKYKGDLYKTVKGSLTSNGIFRIDQKRENEAYWVVCQSKADEFSKRTIDRIQQADKKKTKKVKIQEDSQPHREMQEHIKYEYAHAFGLLNGFLETQPQLRNFIEQIDGNDIERSRALLRNYNFDQIQQGMKECQEFFYDIIRKQKIELIQH